MNDAINIEGLDKAALLVALYERAKPQGLGFLQASSAPMTKDEAIELFVRAGGRFDYVRGRPIKVDFVGDELHGSRLYDRDAGVGECQRIVDAAPKETKT